MDSKRVTKGLARFLPDLLNKKIRPATEPTLYLHIGMPKTGTTAIQRFLFENRSVLLKEQKCLYPTHSMGWYQQVPLVKSIVKSCFPQAIFNKTIADIKPADWLVGLREQYGGIECNKIIVSSEYLWAAPAMQTHLKFHADTEENFSLIEEVIGRTKQTFSEFSDVKIVVYLRRQDTWLESFFNQQIKIGAVIPPENAVMAVKNYLLYAKNLQLWGKYFGQEHVIVRLYEQTASDIIADFCKTVGLDGRGLVKQQSGNSETTNPSLSPRAVKIMRNAIEKQVDQELLERMRIVLTNTSLASTSGSKKPRYSVFSKKFHDQVLSQYKLDTKELVNMYPDSSLYLEPGEVEDEEPSPQAKKNYSWEEQVELLLEELIQSH